ncbi:hypothetical protein [Aridibaculum aurantiacum]|uniref:hypothetical protein n=1 Tax=Aridibaculum aurantiacum TaxID=2810307 RepID=UPI001A97AB7A|nr:hypothetical protein [Aridibaculum aurantiacum]
MTRNSEVVEAMIHLADIARELNVYRKFPRFVFRNNSDLQKNFEERKQTFKFYAAMCASRLNLAS